MKQVLIGSFILAFLLGSAPSMADNHNRGGTLQGVSDAERGHGAPQHKRFLTSRYRDDHRSDGHRSRNDDRRWHGGKERGWKGHPGKRHGWKGHPGRHHGWKRDYHRYKGHWSKHRHHRDRHNGYRYRFHYNGLIGADGYPGLHGGQIMIDLSRR